MYTAPAKIQKVPGNPPYTAILGDEMLEVPCNVTGNPKPTIIWKEGGKLIVEGKHLNQYL